MYSLSFNLTEGKFIKWFTFKTIYVIVLLLDCFTCAEFVLSFWSNFADFADETWLIRCGGNRLIPIIAISLNFFRFSAKSSWSIFFFKSQSYYKYNWQTKTIYNIRKGEKINLFFDGRILLVIRVLLLILKTKQMSYQSYIFYCSLEKVSQGYSYYDILREDLFNKINNVNWFIWIED